MRNKIYIGKIQYKDEEFVGLHQSIIEDKLFNEIQSKLDISKKDKFITHDKSELLLLGLIKCGICGNSMTTSFAKAKDGNKYFYYKCTTKTKFNSNKCISKDISAEEIENFIESLIKNISSSEKIFNSVFQQMNFNESKDKEELTNQKVSLEKNLIIQKREIENLLSYITKAHMEDFDLTTNKLNDLKIQKLQIEGELDKVNAQLDLIKDVKISKKELRAIYSQIPNIFDNLTIEKRSQLIKTIIQEIKLSIEKDKQKGEIEIHFRSDGRIKKEWVNKIANPSELVSSFHLGWLREQDSNLQPFG